jgi:hypothetical protein
MGEDRGETGLMVDNVLSKEDERSKEQANVCKKNQQH